MPVAVVLAAALLALAMPMGTLPVLPGPATLLVMAALCLAALRAQVPLPRALPVLAPLAAALCLALPLVNLATTGQGLLMYLQRGAWQQAGVELVALAFGLMLARMALMLQRRWPQTHEAARRREPGAGCFGEGLRVHRDHRHGTGAVAALAGECTHVRFGPDQFAAGVRAVDRGRRGHLQYP
ncbi:hypothetical protein G6F64_013803 [Rhizopus arrhizus]|uniref:Uncharacterized protein n=1 Tax=Rhizopus oryzae TaxID=64495 RepID=A0A9P7BKE8_RHIOR|nr:hypothetical protein G6F64_013803 [Rhizopus arrhizus]